MTLLRVHGVNRVTAKGRVYYYHRATGVRLRADPSNARAFSAEVDALDAGSRATELRRAALPGSLGALLAKYRAAPEFADALKPATRKSYERVFAAVQPLDELDLDDLDQPYLLALRDRINRASGRWLANYTTTVLSVVMAWGMPRGYVDTNAAAGVPKIRKPKGSGVANKAWKPAEVEAVLKAAQRKGFAGLRKAVALAYYGGLRISDVVVLPLAGRSKGAIEIVQSKTDHELTIFESRRLQIILDEPNKVDQAPAATRRIVRASPSTIVQRDDGRPYTVDGLDSLFHRIKAELAAVGTIRDGLTFHGLRKSLGKRAADAGHSELAIAAAMGHSNPASSRVYTIEANRRRGSKQVFKSLNRKR